MTPTDKINQAIQIVVNIVYLVREDSRRYRRAIYSLIFSSTGFLFLCGVETFFVAMMFQMLDLDILGHSVSGSIFGLFVPTLMIGYHLRTHRDGDELLKQAVSKASGIGILVLVFAISLMVGYSAWEAANDAATIMNDGPSGGFGSKTFDETAKSTSSWIDTFSSVPKALLFFGLSFGMTISLYVASAALDRAIEAFNIIVHLPPRSKEFRKNLKKMLRLLKQLRRRQKSYRRAEEKQPPDTRLKFARRFKDELQKIAVRKRAAASLKFSAEVSPDLLFEGIGPKESLPLRFTSEQEVRRQINDVLDEARVYKTLRLLTGRTSEKG